ncbi:FecR family protein [Delftia lacustris]|uniref:Transmembrane sensor n=1 Tax=Delftia lacustris TaxID=558537 RepID=A0A1H3PC95_9BURK|nr:FecR domain-containing protein [Delftia lacustris]SDY98435.1 transmembrane sensor [Delftia lacustris]
MNKTPPPGMAPDTLVDLHEAAAQWFTRRQTAGWTGADERALDAWLQADPFHREIFDSMGRTRQLFGQLQQERVQAQAQAQAQKQVKAQRPPAHEPARRRTAPSAMQTWPGRWRAAFATAGVALCCALLVGGWHAWDNTARYTLQMATGPGETREVDMPDGSHVTVNFSSTLQVRYYPRRREVVLDSGEAFFEVAPDASRPFTVDSGRSRVKVVGTAFNVRAAPPRLVVKVLRGKVEVRADRDAADGPVMLLGPASGVSIDPVTGGHDTVAAPADTVGDWRTGQLRFRRTPLDEVARELSRYLGQPVVLASEELGSLPVSAFFSTASPEPFIELLPDLIPVRVRRQASGGWLIARR